MYSHKEMEALCLDLAETADPLEASALREVAQNYKTAVEPAPKVYELKFWHLVLAVVAIYAILTPIYLLIPFVPEPAPSGRIVEHLSGFVRSGDGIYTTRTYRFAAGEKFVDGVRQWSYDQDAVPLVVYEGATPLPKGSYDIQELSRENIWRYVTLKMSDGTDPNKNGHRYFIVLP